MNNKFILVTLLFGLTCLLSSCGSNTSNGDDPAQPLSPVESDTTGQTVGQEAIKTIEIPKDELREQNLKAAAAASPFAQLGCCDNETNYGNDCCCNPVIETYRTMVAAQDTSIARLKMTDPILSTCRKKHQAVFDKIDYPEEDYDDMVQQGNWSPKAGC